MSHLAVDQRSFKIISHHICVLNSGHVSSSKQLFYFLYTCFTFLSKIYKIGQITFFLAECFSKHLHGDAFCLIIDIFVTSAFASFLFLAKRFGVTEVALEAVNFISHATQSRLRTVLEKVSSIAQHRMDSCKVRLHVCIWI